MTCNKVIFWQILYKKSVPFYIFDLYLYNMKTIVLITALLLAIPSFAQNELSLDLGRGITGAVFFSIDKQQFDKMYLGGINFASSIHDSILFFTSGLNFISRTFTGNYLYVPVGLEYLSGHRMLFVIGGGIYFNTLVYEAEDYILNKSVLGGYGKIGTGFRLNDKFRIMLALRINADITTSGERVYYHMAGRYATYHKVWYNDKFLTLSLYYKL